MLKVEMPSTSPAYVQRALSDLREQLDAVGPERLTSLELVVNGGEADALGDEGFRLEVKDGSVRAVGSTWQGAHYALLEIVRRLAESPAEHALPEGLSITERPRFAIRAMYAHTAWVYNNPYALRSWAVEDWKRYVDLLAYLRVNVLQIWNLISIMPQPLSDPDREYLRMFREIIRYAKEERGFKAVWVGDAANNVALPSGKPIGQREYYVVHSLRNPADQDQLQQILSSRREFYRENGNADGYWIIDSDPGNWPGSPSEDFVTLLKENRKLIDEASENGPAAELIYWIWQGWGNGSQEENLTAILKSTRDLHGGSFRLLACFPETLKVLTEFSLLDRTTWFPYGAIEGEPNSPWTGCRFAEIRNSLQTVLGSPGLTGVMGNAQTPLVQAPNLWLFHHMAWNPSHDPGGLQPTLDAAARAVFPEAAADLSRAWALLTAGDERESLQQANRLSKLLDEDALGHPGTLGRFLPEQGKWLVRNLADQLTIHAISAGLVTALQEASAPDRLVGLILAYVGAVGAMVDITGFRPALDKKGQNLLPFFNWFLPDTDLRQTRAAWDEYKAAHPAEAEKIYASVRANASAKKRHAADIIEFLIGTPPTMAEGFKYAN